MQANANTRRLDGYLGILAHRLARQLLQRAKKCCTFAHVKRRVANHTIDNVAHSAAGTPAESPEDTASELLTYLFFKPFKTKVL